MIDIRDARTYIEHFLQIRTKSGRVQPFILNPAQIKLDDALRAQDAAGKPMRALVLKARQLGFSTYTEGLIFSRAATQEQHPAMILAHLDTSTAALFAMERLFYDRLPPLMRPMLKKSNDTELLFENPTRSQKEKDKNPGLQSSIVCNTAGAGHGIGRGTMLRSLHCSEFAFWRGNKADTLTGLLQAVPGDKGTLVVIESTANGFEEFEKLWEAAVKGENDFAAIFCGWQENAEYRKPVPPGTVWTEKELEMKARLGLDDEQLAWRRWCIQNNCHGDERMFRQEYPSTPDEAFLTTGTGVFDNELVMARKQAAPDPERIGRFAYDYDGERITGIRWMDDAFGWIKIYGDGETWTAAQGRPYGETEREPSPKDGSREERSDRANVGCGDQTGSPGDARPGSDVDWRAPYVLAGDTAGEGSDYFTGQLLDNSTGRQKAVLRMPTDEIEYTRQMYCLGLTFNKALMGIECNFTTYPQRELERLNYPNFYWRERYDTNTNAMGRAYGFRTDGKTRPVIISGLKDAFHDHPESFIDRDTLGEMLTFIRSDAGRPEAVQGEHDDLVMALAIAHEIRKQQRVTPLEEAENPKPRLKDQFRNNKNWRRI